MSFFERPPEEVVLASPMSGQITLHGKPAAGAKVVRKVQQNNGEEFVDETITDNKGIFKLPILKKNITLFKLEQYSVKQIFTVNYAGDTYQIWYLKTSSRKEYGELGRKPSNIRCELNGEENTMMTDYSMMITKCVWDEMESYRTTID